jgi:hypothetical protein
MRKSCHTDDPYDSYFKGAFGGAATVRRRLICPSGNLSGTLSSPAAKNISLQSALEAALLIRAIPCPPRGAYRDRHERWARDAMDALARETSAHIADGEVVWS